MERNNTQVEADGRMDRQMKRVNAGLLGVHRAFHSRSWLQVTDVVSSHEQRRQVVRPDSPDAAYPPTPLFPRFFPRFFSFFFSERCQHWGICGRTRSTRASGWSGLVADACCTQCWRHTYPRPQWSWLWMRQVCTASSESPGNRQGPFLCVCVA